MKKSVFLMTIGMAFASVYMIQASFDPSSLTIDATQIVHWVSPYSSPTSKALFLLYPNLHEEENPKVSPLMKEDSEGWIRILEVSVDGRRASFTTDESFTEMYQSYSKKHTLLSIDLGREVSPNQEVEIAIRFKLKFPEKGMDEGCYGGLCLWRFGWYPLEVYVRDGENYEGFVYTPHICYLKISTPKGWKAVYHEGSGMGCPIAFLDESVYGDYELDGKDYRVVVHHRRGTKEQAMVIASIVLHALQVFSERFGSLEYKTVHVIESPYSQLFGMTAPGMVTLGDNAFTTANLVLPGFTLPLREFLVYHEVAHLWFGLGATVDFSTTNFLSESLAQYAAITQVEEERSATENLYDPDVPDILSSSLEDLFTFKSLRENYLYIYREASRSGIDSAVAGKGKTLNGNFPRNYAKGYFAMRTLSLLFEDFDVVLKEYHREFKGKVVLYDDFKRFILERKPNAAEALEKLFESDGGLEVEVKRRGNDIVVRGPEGVPYEVEVVKEGVREIVVASGTIVLKADEVHADPRWLLPDPDRFDNYYPRLFMNPLSKEVSPLEAYKLDFAFSSLTLSASSVYLGFGISVSKFDEWGFSVTSGSFYEIEEAPKGANVEELGSGFSGGFFFSPSSYSIFSGTAFGDLENLYGGLQLGMAIPEKLDIGYSLPYVYPRLRLFTGLYRLPSETGLWGEVDFVDLVKSSLAAAFYSQTDLDMNWLVSGQVSVFPSKFLDISARGLYSSAGIEFGGGVIRSFAEGSVGIHLDYNIPWRTNLANILSFRGIHLSLKGGAEMYGTDSMKVDPTIEASLILKFQAVLDMPVLFGVNLRIYPNRGIYYYFGSSFQDTILATIEMGAFLKPLLKNSQFGFWDTPRLLGE